MDATAIYQNLSAKFVNKIGSLTTDLGDPFLFIECDAIVEVGEYLRDDESLSFDFLESISGLDNGEHLDLVYHLFSYKHRHSIVLKIRAKGDHDTIPSCHQVWPAANWHEREAFDLFGFDFSNHPDLRRILLPDDWDGHPLRKNYEYPEEYHGIEHHRDDPLDQFKALDDLVAKAKVKAEEAKTKKAQSTETDSTDSTDSTAAEPTVTESSSDSNNSEQETK